MANLRELQKETTRKRLMSSALDLFQDRGYAATTIDDIATSASTTRVTFYAHFPSKRDVMIALLAELNPLLERTADTEHGASAPSLVAAVEAGTQEAIEAWIREQAARWPQIKPYILVATEASAGDEEIRQLYGEWFDSVIADVVDGLTRADRHDPATRRFMGELALAQLDHTAIAWMRDAWDLDDDPRLHVLARSWQRLLGAGD